MVLEKDGEIISAAVLRFHGTRLAEMPFVGTLPAYQKQGMCHRLLKAVKQLLASLQVEKLVTSAVSDLVETWKRSFSFIPLEPELREEVKNLSLVVFADTTLLQKPIPIPQASAQQGRLTASTEAGTDNNIPTDLLKYTSPNGSDGTPPLTDDERAALEMETFSSFSALLTGNAFPPFCRSNLQAAQQQYLAAYEFAQGSLMATGVNSTSLGYGSPFGNLLRGWP